MNLPDAPVAHEGFFAAHFFTVKDQEKSRDLYVRILGRNVVGRLPGLVSLLKSESGARSKLAIRST